MTGYRIEIEGKEEAVAVEAVPPIEIEAKEEESVNETVATVPVIATDDTIAPADDSSATDEEATAPLEIVEASVEESK